MGSFVVGLSVVGRAVGSGVGARVGRAVGSTDGLWVGDADGADVGAVEGSPLVGAGRVDTGGRVCRISSFGMLGWGVGQAVGTAVGRLVGPSITGCGDGTTVGSLVGEFVGASVGKSVGASVGTCDSDGASVGSAELGLGDVGDDDGVELGRDDGSLLVGGREVEGANVAVGASDGGAEGAGVGVGVGRNAKHTSHDSYAKVSSQPLTSHLFGTSNATQGHPLSGSPVLYQRDDSEGAGVGLVDGIDVDGIKEGSTDGLLVGTPDGAALGVLEGAGVGRGGVEGRAGDGANDGTFDVGLRVSAPPTFLSGAALGAYVCSAVGRGRSDEVSLVVGAEEGRNDGSGDGTDVGNSNTGGVGGTGSSLSSLLGANVPTGTGVAVGIGIGPVVGAYDDVGVEVGAYGKDGDATGATGDALDDGAAEGEAVGLYVGSHVGVKLGNGSGTTEGTGAGAADGVQLGVIDGVHVGARIGSGDGALVGAGTGCVVGAKDGASVGSCDGAAVGEPDGPMVVGEPDGGTVLGAVDGEGDVGIEDGVAVGTSLGAGEGCSVGAGNGRAVGAAGLGAGDGSSDRGEMGARVGKPVRTGGKIELGGANSIVVGEPSPVGNGDGKGDGCGVSFDGVGIPVGHGVGSAVGLGVGNCVGAALTTAGMSSNSDGSNTSKRGAVRASVGHGVGSSGAPFSSTSTRGQLRCPPAPLEVRKGVARSENPLFPLGTIHRLVTSTTTTGAHLVRSRRTTAIHTEASRVRPAGAGRAGASASRRGCPATLR